jgi:hypothetical protein
MASHSSEDITIIAAECIIAERTGVPKEEPTGTCWPQLLYALKKGHLSACGIIDCYSNKTEMIQQRFPSGYVSRRFGERKMIKAGLFPIKVPHGWWLLRSVPTHLRGTSFCLWREAGDHYEVLREITINKGDIDRLWPDEVVTDTAPASVRKTKKSDTQLSDTVEALKKIYPEGESASINRSVIAKKVKERLGRTVSLSTIDRARKLAWPAK